MSTAGVPATGVGNVYTYKGDMRQATYVGRPTIYGNPYKGPDAIAAFLIWWYLPAQSPLRARARLELTGRVLRCWCSPAACHVDTIANYLNHVVPLLTEHAWEVAG